MDIPIACPDRTAGIDADIARQTRARAGTVFGLWKNRAVDALAYQEALRSEW
ncbi:hypothetical protein ACVBGC_02965 [Burkholderia stagnalis]